MRAALCVLLLMLAGCSSPAEPTTCAPDRASIGGGEFCLATRDGWFLHGVEWNDDRPQVAVLVHGLNEDLHSYDALAQELAAAGWRVLAFDSRGHGASIHRADGTTSHAKDFAPEDFLAMERDLDAMQERIGRAPDLLVGASVGSSEALRWAAGTRTALVLLSPGAEYRGLDTADADVRHEGAAYFVASSEDLYAARSAETLDAHHAGPHALKLWDGKGHGTQILDDEGRADVLAWIAALGEA